MSADGPPTGPLDFRGLDFDRLWKGREKTTEVEQRLVRGCVASGDARRILEVGPGGGRIASVLWAPEREFVGVDITLEFLVRLRARWGGAGRWVAADLAQLPLSSGAFTGAVMIRVYDFLVEPATCVRELHRVLAPGGWLLVSYFPEPSVASVWGDLRRRVREPRPRASKPPAPPPHRPGAPSRERFRATVEEAGFRWECEYSVGLEDFRPLRWLPAHVFVALARSFGQSGALPHHFVLLRKAGEPPHDLPAIEGIVECPHCRASVPGLLGADEPSRDCPGCRLPITVVQGVPDLRPFPRPSTRPGRATIQVRTR